ncbi:ABC transporter substrate-binding protein, partial [Rhodovulum sulfidophilum]|nr:ABC transporter substrate-binding protein [Rhodovulum sulfidophilum]
MKRAALLALLLPAPAMADPLTVVLDWFVNPDHGPIIVAERQGWFAEAGLEVEIVAPADPADPPKMAASGQADLAVTYQPQLYLQHAEGLPLKRVGTLVESPLYCVMTKADGPVQGLADLKGRKVGFSVAGIEEALLHTMLRTNGVEPAEVEFVNVNF